MCLGHGAPITSRPNGPGGEVSRGVGQAPDREEGCTNSSHPLEKEIHMLGTIIVVVVIVLAVIGLLAILRGRAA